MIWLDENRRRVLEAYADAGMKVSEAARRLGVGQDTVRHHLTATRTQTGLDPKSFWDLARLLGLRRKGERK